jgi:hypothetical protein
VEPGVACTRVQRPAMLLHLPCHPGRKSSAAIKLVTLAAARSVCAVNRLAALCGVSGSSSLVALPGWSAAAQLVANGCRGAANLSGNGSV